MKEHPISFNGPMIRAILEGRKTQTRRVIKYQPTQCGLIWIETTVGFAAWQDEGLLLDEHSEDGGPCQRKCPYGRIDDQLWVRENWQAWTEHNRTKTADLPEEMRRLINYTANGNTWDARIRPPAQMPRWASRITLNVDSVQVERLQDIDEEDALAEGMRCDKDTLAATGHATYIDAFRDIWKQINGPDSWNENPWVWKIEFSIKHIRT